MGWHPHGLKLAGPQELRQRARIEPVGLRARLTDAVSPGETTMILLAWGSSRRAISRELPVTSSATRSVRSRLSTNVLSPSGVDGTRPAEYTFPSSQIAISLKSRCTSSPTHLPSGLDSNLLTSHSFRRVTVTWVNGRERVGERHRPIRARSAPGQVARGRHRKARAGRPSSKTACPTAFSTTRSPLCPVPATTRPDQRFLWRDFSCPENEASPAGRGGPPQVCSLSSNATTRTPAGRALAIPGKASKWPRRRLALLSGREQNYPGARLLDVSRLVSVDAGVWLAASGGLVMFGG